MVEFFCYFFISISSMKNLAPRIFGTSAFRISILNWSVALEPIGLENFCSIVTHFLRSTLLKSIGISITDVFHALANSNENTGGAYIEKNPNTYYIRTDGVARSLTDLENIVVDVRNGRPILIKDVATVQFGKAPRYGALVRDGEEAVGGRVMMLKGAKY